MAAAYSPTESVSPSAVRSSIVLTPPPAKIEFARIVAHPSVCPSVLRARPAGAFGWGVTRRQGLRQGIDGESGDAHALTVFEFDVESLRAHPLRALLIALAVTRGGRLFGGSLTTRNPPAGLLR